MLLKVEYIVLCCNVDNCTDLYINVIKKNIYSKV